MSPLPNKFRNCYKIKIMYTTGNEDIDTFEQKLLTPTQQSKAQGYKRCSEIMARIRNSSTHLRDPDKAEGLWKEKKDIDRTRSKKREKIVKENLFLQRFPEAPKHKRKTRESRADNLKSTDNLLKSTYCSNSKRRKLSQGRKTFYPSTKRNYFNRTSSSKFTLAQTTRPPFKPAGFMKARDEIADKDNFLL